MPRATWFCIDIECSGPVPGLYDMISLGAVPVVEAGDGLEVTPREQGFYIEIVPTAPRWSQRTVPIHGLTREHLEQHGVALSEALDRLDAFVTAHTVPGSEPVFVGHNAPFDWSFVSYAYHALERNNPFGYKALDTKALSMGVLGLHWFDSNKENLQQALGLPEHDDGQAHRADYDAWYQALILAGLLNKVAPCADS